MNVRDKWATYRRRLGQRRPDTDQSTFVSDPSADGVTLCTLATCVDVRHTVYTSYVVRVLSRSEAPGRAIYQRSVGPIHLEVGNSLSAIPLNREHPPSACIRVRHSMPGNNMLIGTQE